MGGDSITWVNNKGGPHNVVFDEEAIPSGVNQESISMDTQLGDEGETFTKKFDVAGSYAYYCEPHRGAGMNGALVVGVKPDSMLSKHPCMRHHAGTTAPSTHTGSHARALVTSVDTALLMHWAVWCGANTLARLCRTNHVFCLVS